MTVLTIRFTPRCVRCGGGALHSATISEQLAFFITLFCSGLIECEPKRNDDGGIIEEWMRRRGFIGFGEEAAGAAAEIVEMY